MNGQGSPNDDGITVLRSIAQILSALTQSFRGLQDQAGTTGSFTFPAAASVVVPNVNVRAGSLIFLTPQNALAGTQVSAATSPYIAPVDYVAGVSFTVRTASAGAATVGAIFGYRIVNTI